MSDMTPSAGLSPAPILLRSSTPAATFHSLVWTRVFNARQDHSILPFAYSQPLTVSDIIAAVKLAKSNARRISIRSGGHSWAAWSVRHDAVLIDLVELDRSLPGGRIQYDETTQVVSCPPSITGEELNDFLAGKGRMFPGGHCPDVGLGGFLLQGGMGWNCKSWGWACEYLVSLDVVTASGEYLQHVSATFHRDLFWAARGAGPGFPAIVTRFHLKTVPLPEMYQSLYFFPITDFKEVLEWLIDISPTIPSTEIVLVSSYFPSSPSNPSLSNQILANFLTFAPTKESQSILLSKVHSSLPPAVSPLPSSRICFPTSLAEQYSAQRLANPLAHRYRSDNIYVPDAAAHPSSISKLLEPVFTSLPTAKSSALWFSMSPGGGTGQPRRGSDDGVLGDHHHHHDGMALSMQTDHYVAVYAVWDDNGDDDNGDDDNDDDDNDDDGEKDDEKCDEWVRKLGELESEGSYLGDADFRFREAGWKFWGDEQRETLWEVRKKWDEQGRICGFLDNTEPTNSS
ncbi:FAD binding domain protein [Cladorrhinum samala]|uniref:FAD binding domain protein n=1 Tax=Cladorrhinum samala TaxID=585594 RepID=A0AAV9HBH3_9PEZI|nr:FAD binding domain protein [Cladorrhinum samala]